MVNGQLPLQQDWVLLNNLMRGAKAKRGGLTGFRAADFFQDISMASRSWGRTSLKGKQKGKELVMAKRPANSSVVPRQDSIHSNLHMLDS